MFVVDEELPEPIDRLLVSPPLQRFALEREFLASHAMDENLIAEVARGDKISFLDGRHRRIEEVVRAFLTRMAETGRENTPPLDDFDLDEDEEGRDDAVA
jgi:hypothetical protein